MKKTLLFMLLLVSSLVFSQIPTTNIKAYYQLDNASTTDFLGINNLVQTGSAAVATTNRLGTANTAIALNGDSYSRPDIDYGSTNGDFSVSFWVKTTTNSTNEKILISHLENYSFFSVGNEVLLYDGKIGLRLKYGLSNNSFSFTTTYNSVAFSEFIADGNWHHITVISDILRATVYTDNVLTAQAGNNNQATFTYKITNPNSPIYISPNSVNQYQDEIDDIIFYDRVLTQTEIEGIGNNNGYCFPPSDDDVTIANITETEATLNWVGTGTYDIAYGLSSDSFSNYTQVSGITTNTSTLTNLSASNSYTVYIRQQCSASINSNWRTVNFSSGGPVYVDASATGSNNGSSFTDAYTDLNTALANKPGKEIWIAAGTYIPTQSGATDREYSFSIPANTKLYGGFNGTEIDLSQRNPSANITILSGDINGDDDGLLAHNNTLYSDNSYHVVTVTANNVVLDGLTIKGGNSNGTGANIYGAALTFNTQSVVTLDLNRVIFEDNRASTAGIIYGTDSVVNTDAHYFNFKSCIIKNNIARFATVMYISNPRSTNNVYTNISNTLIYDNFVRDVSSSSTGTNTLFWFRSDNVTRNIAILDNCTITKNRFYGTNSQSAGVISSSRISGVNTVNIYNTIIWDNLVYNLSEQISLDRVGTQSLPNNVSIRNSLGPDNFSNWSPQNSINTNPLFTNSTNNDFTLQSSSPAIDSGDSNYITQNIDILGNNRVFNTIVDLGAYEFGSASLSTDEFDNNKAQHVFYPNPVQDLLTIQSDKDIKSVALFNLQGQKVLTSTQKQISVSNLAKGVYMLQVIDVANAMSTQKIIKN